MYCKKCGSQIKENQRFCPNCGAEQKSQDNPKGCSPQAKPEIKPEIKPEPVPMKSEETVKKGGNKKKVYGIAAAAAVICAVGGFWFVKNANTRVYVKDHVAYVKEGILKKKDSLIEAEIPEGAIQIADEAFVDCENLKYVSIPDTVAEIGEQVFFGCENLSEIDLNHVQKIGNKAFYNCKNLNNVSLGDLTELGEEAFVNTAVQNVNIPDKMKEKGVFAFVDAFEGTPYYDSMERIECYDISELTRELYIEKNYCYDNWIDGLLSISPNASMSLGYNDEAKSQLLDRLYRDLESWDSIYYGNTDEGMYYAMSSDNTASFIFKDREMSKVEIPGCLYTDQEVYTVRRIFRGSLLGSEDVEEIIMPDQLQVLGAQSLLGTSIKKIEKFPNSLQVIGDSSLPVLTEQTELILPNGLQEIGKKCFRSLPVEEVELPDSLTQIREEAFRDSSLRAIEIPDSVEVLGEIAFINCSNLTEVKLPNNEKLTEIPSFSFRNCTSLKSIEIPDHITAIGEAAFAGCTSLTAVTIPDHVTELGESAFEECTSLTTVNIPDHVNRGMYAFRGCTSLENMELLDDEMDNNPEFDDSLDLEEDDSWLDEQVMVVIKCDESITLRTSPSTAAAEICQIPLGAHVKFIETAGEEFYRVEYNGQTGYVLAEYLGNRYADTGSASLVVVNCSESITLRKKPSTSAEEICQIPLNQIVNGLANADEEFWMVEYQGKIGYALKSYLEPAE